MGKCINATPIDRVDYLQIEPQHYWHHEAYIRGNREALLALAEVLTKAANGTEAATGTLFASDGEGYHVIAIRVDRPDDLPDPFYSCQIDHPNYSAASVEYCGKCGKPR
jgi:hypothetical protein